MTIILVITRALGNGPRRRELLLAHDLDRKIFGRLAPRPGPGASAVGCRSRRRWKAYVGTVGVTAVGMFVEGVGWGIPPAVPTLMITVGGIGEKPAVIDGHIATRSQLSLTISFDHNIVDGAPAARFAEQLKALIESGYSLPDPTVDSEQAGAEAAKER